jgi:hypothetical protein
MFVVPLSIGPFLMGEEGQLTLRSPEPVPGFSFTWRRTGFIVKLAEGNLVLRAIAGRIPSTADGRNQRDTALTLLRAMPACMPVSIRLRLLPDYRIQLEMAHEFQWPTTAPALITPIVWMLMKLRPVLDLLEEAALNAP